MISERDRIVEESMMDVAERYLGELLKRSMVQGKAPGIPSLFRYFSSCRLHDFMKDLSLHKAAEESFLLMKSPLNQFKMLKVLAIEGHYPVEEDHLKRLKDVGKLIHFRYLSLRDSEFVSLPSSIGNLQHLQTLDLRFTKVPRIPMCCGR
ncbi:hypothetical protein ACH5RR_007429 [Cinchona calisaya]|uniref:Uncharacterized protein n=1 Tax=Cinchona calisaya TaxID=153742 RepID=A0ABD3ARW8_9GENT